MSSFHKYYRIKTRKGQAVQLKGVLRVVDFDHEDQSQLFRLEPVDNYKLQHSAIIVNKFTDKAIDVPEATFEYKNGKTRLIQWEKNRRWNQRWYF